MAEVATIAFEMQTQHPATEQPSTSPQHANANASTNLYAFGLPSHPCVAETATGAANASSVQAASTAARSSCDSWWLGLFCACRHWFWLQQACGSGVNESLHPSNTLNPLPPNHLGPFRTPNPPTHPPTHPPSVTRPPPPTGDASRSSFAAISTMGSCSPPAVETPTAKSRAVTNESWLDES